MFNTRIQTHHWGAGGGGRDGPAQKQRLGSSDFGPADLGVSSHRLPLEAFSSQARLGSSQ